MWLKSIEMIDKNLKKWSIAILISILAPAETLELL
jgi:hypothetical protein